MRAGATSFGAERHKGVHPRALARDCDVVQALTLTLRDKQLKTRFGMASLQGLIIGLAFLDIGNSRCSSSPFCSCSCRSARCPTCP